MWKNVVLDEYYDIDLDTSLLYIKTTSALGSGEKLVIWYYSTNMNDAGGMGIWFKQSTSNIHYTLHSCKTYAAFPKRAPLDNNKLWIIEKSGFRTVVTCNGKIVLDITASSETCDYDSDKWKYIIERKVGFVMFPREHNTATALYDTG